MGLSKWAEISGKNEGGGHVCKILGIEVILKKKTIFLKKFEISNFIFILELHFLIISLYIGNTHNHN